MKFIVLHSTNTRETSRNTLTGFGSDDIGTVRAAVKAYKASARPDLHEGLYKFAGIVDVDGINDVFEATQESWEDGQRSSMVGDVFLQVTDGYEYIKGQAFAVTSCGFLKLEV